jgi:hypothetical protein
MSANPYLEKLHALKAKKGYLSPPSKLTKPGFVGFVGDQGTVSGFGPEQDGFVSFVSDQSSRFSDLERTFGHTLGALQSGCPNLESGCPHLVPPARWQQAIEDGRAFLAKWGRQAEALGWTALDLFGLHQPPAKPHPSYGRLYRYDETGLIWLLEGRKVLALTRETAAIHNPSGSITTYRRRAKPALAGVHEAHSEDGLHRDDGGDL